MPPKFSVAALALPLCLATAALSFAAALETPWQALERLPKHARYIVLKRDGSCVSGGFGSLSNDWLVLTIGRKHSQSVFRTDIIRMSFGDTPDVRATVYSGRSSWLDVRALEKPSGDTDLSVITTDAREFIGHFLSASEDKLNIAVDGNEIRFSKAFVAKVSLRSAETVDPNLNARPKRIMPVKQPVPLYQVTFKEDDSPVSCRRQ